MRTRLVSLTVITILSMAVGLLHAQTSDTLHSYGSHEVFPIAGILGGETVENWDSLQKMLGLNSLSEFWGAPLDPAAIPMEICPSDTTEPIKDPFYYNTDSNITYQSAARSVNYNYSLWALLQNAIHGSDVRCYLPGTCPGTLEYAHPWKLARGGNDTIYNPPPPRGSGDPNEWYIPDTAGPSGSYVLRLADSTGVNSGAFAPYGINSGTVNGYIADRPEDIGACTYDFVFYMPSPGTGTTPLYQLEFWSVGNGDNTKLDSVVITGKSYALLPIASTQVGGRTVGAEKLYTWPGVPLTAQYKLLRATIPASVIRTLYGTGFTHTPIIDVRLKTFGITPIQPRLLRIRNWIGQQVLSGKCDSILKEAASMLGVHFHNNLAKSWSAIIEEGDEINHDYAYVSNLLCDDSLPPLNAMEGGFPNNIASIYRDQCEAKNASKGQMWIEVNWFNACGGWRIHTSNFWFGDTGSHDPGYSPVPGAIMPDSAGEYKHGIHVIKKHDQFTQIWQNYTFGYGSENPGGGYGQDGEFFQYVRIAYGQNPPVPVYVLAQALAGNTMVPKWAMDSIENIWYNTYTTSYHYPCAKADSLARAKEDSISVATIFQPYFARHPRQEVTLDSIVDPLWYGRFPTTTEMSLQLWSGVTHGLKGYAFNYLGDDGLRQHGLVDNNWKETQDQTGIHYSAYNDLQTYCATENNEYCGNNPSLFTHETVFPDTNGVHIALPNGFKPLFHEAQREMRDDLAPITTELSKLDWIGVVSWPWRDSTPTYLSRLPVKNLGAKNLSGVSDSITYVDLGIHKDPGDSLAMYCSVLNRLLWTDSTGTDQTDTRTITMSVRDSAFNPFYIGWPTWEIKNVATGWDTVVDSSFSLTLGAGRGALLRIAPSQSITIGKLTTNVWNNARHLAFNETNFDTTHQYWMVYERKGNIYANAPLETPSEGSSKREPDPVLGELLLENCGKAHNPAIAINPDSGRGYGVVYSIDHAGTTTDSTFIIFRFAYSVANRIYVEKDTLEAFPVSDAFYVAAPAISPAKPMGTWGGSVNYPFWVGWRNPTHGGAIEKVGPNHYHTNIRYFSGGDPSNTKFISLASRVTYGEPVGWPGDTRCYIAFQETVPDAALPSEIADYGNIYYLEAWEDSINTNIIDTGRLTKISAGTGSCWDRTPSIAVDDGGQVNVTWEHPQETKWMSLKHVMMREKNNYFPPAWSDFREWFVAQTLSPFYALAIDTIMPLPQNVITWGPAVMPWLDLTRIAWSDNYTGHVSIAHFGFTPLYEALKWYRHHLVESSLQPSLSVYEQTEEGLPDALMYRSTLKNADTTYDAKITRYNFPLTPVRVDSLIMQTITASNKTDCVVLGIRVGGSPQPTAYPPTGWTPTSAPWQPIDPNPFDTTQPHPHVTWATPSVKTSTFFANAGDSLSYTRFFHVGTFTAGDTAAVQTALDSVGGDYFRASINLRRAADSAIILVLDTARLTRSAFVSSTNVADSGYGHAVIPITDSLFLTMDVSRGDSSDNLTLAHIESFDDPIQDVLPTPPDSGGGGGFKRADPQPQASGTQQQELDVTVHPNPVHGTVKICVADLPQGIPATVDVVNAMGVQVATLYDATPDAELGLCLTLDCSNLPSGTYYADLQTQGLHKAVQFQVVK